MTSTIFHQFRIDDSRENVLRYLTRAEGISAWWDKATEAETPQGHAWEFNPGEGHGVLRLLHTESHTANSTIIRWHCISEHEPTSPASAWTGTTIEFELTQEAGILLGYKPEGIEVYFRHSGWNPESKFLGFCNFNWASALMNLVSVAEESAS